MVFFLKNGLTGSYFSFGGVSVMIGLFAIFMPFSFAPLKADLSDKLSKLDPWLLMINKKLPVVKCSVRGLTRNRYSFSY